MKRFLMIALAGAALTFFMPAKESKAADIYIGSGPGYGHVGGYYSSRRYGYHRGPHSGYHPRHDFRYRVAPPYRGPYRSYRPYRGHRGGLQLNVGPLHLGVGRYR